MKESNESLDTKHADGRVCNNSAQGGGRTRTAPRKAPLATARKARVLITGGAGFVGTNLAAGLLERGHRVLLLDNLSRPGVEHNLNWLVARYGSDIDIHRADICSEDAVRAAVSEADRVYHFAAQVAVTTSICDPRADFSVNAQGTFNVLEAARRRPNPPPVLFTSTNKVYGKLGCLELVEDGRRYEPSDCTLAAWGVDENQPLDFQSPYGCSKGAADQYVLDYARSYRLPAIVFRMSCIYGLHQCGTEDQGWVAHFLIQALKGEPITIYGDGQQVRDVLFADDLVTALITALDHADQLQGHAYNIGGGPTRSLSLLELVSLIETLHPKGIECSFEDWRQGDQRYYVSDTRAFEAATGWSPQVDVPTGVQRLYRWLKGEMGVRDPNALAVGKRRQNGVPVTAIAR